MDKYEYGLKKEHLKQLVNKGSMKEAAQVCDSIDWELARDIYGLQIAAEVYQSTDQYEKELQVLKQAYHMNHGYRFAYRLAEAALDHKDYKTAEYYYEEFQEKAPEDPRGLLLEYRLAAGKNHPVAELIQILEEYKAAEFEERWGYELAELYHRAGEKEKCVRLCDEIAIWFGFGPYVDKAMKLKVIYSPLTEEQSDYQQQISKMTQEFAAQWTSDRLEQEDISLDDISSDVEGTDVSGKMVATLIEEESLQDIKVSQEILENVYQKTGSLFGEAPREYLEEQEPVTLESIEKVQEIQEAYDAKVQMYQQILLEEDTAPEVQMEASVTAESGEGMDLEGAGAIRHFIVSSEVPVAGFHFAQGVLKQMSRSGMTLPSDKTAKTNGSKLNRMGLISMIRGLLGKVLIVEEAGVLSDALIGEFGLLLKRPDVALLVVFIDTEKNLEKLFARSEELYRCFSRKFVVNGFSVEELEEYAGQYALKKNYVLAESALLAIEERLEEISCRKDGTEKESIEAMIDHAIGKSAQKSFGKVLKSFFVLVRDEEEHIYLRAEDFKE